MSRTTPSSIIPLSLATVDQLYPTRPTLGSYVVSELYSNRRYPIIGFGWHTTDQILVAEVSGADYQYLYPTWPGRPDLSHPDSQFTVMAEADYLRVCGNALPVDTLVVYTGQGHAIPLLSEIGQLGRIREVRLVDGDLRYDITWNARRTTPLASEDLPARAVREATAKDRAYFFGVMLAPTPTVGSLVRYAVVPESPNPQPLVPFDSIGRVTRVGGEDFYTVEFLVTTGATPMTIMGSVHRRRLGSVSTAAAAAYQSAMGDTQSASTMTPGRWYMWKGPRSSQRARLVMRLNENDERTFQQMPNAQVSEFGFQSDPAMIVVVCARYGTLWNLTASDRVRPATRTEMEALYDAD